MVKSCAAFGCKNRWRKECKEIRFHSFPTDEKKRKMWVYNTRRVHFKPSNSSKLCSKHFTEDCFNREKHNGVRLKPFAVPTIFDFHKKPVRQKRLSKKRKMRILEENLQLSSSSGIKSDIMVPSSIPCETSVPSIEFESVISVVKCETSIPVVKSETSIHVVKRETSVPLTNSQTSVPLSNLSEAEVAKQYRFLRDFKEDDMLDPMKARRFLFIAKQQTQRQNLILKHLNQAVRRLMRRAALLRIILHELKKKQINNMVNLILW